MPGCRIIYVLPYTTIIEQNADEIRKVLEHKGKKYSNRIVLEHHSNLMPHKETARQKVLSENWDVPVVLTTNVQILEALFGAGTRGVRGLKRPSYPSYLMLHSRVPRGRVD